ncbi:MAG: hypothetical protein EOS72_03155 [Mesorhizobium sp.]|uniref:hypothetical protein n=1 Tax=Mesorhizobium sp. TaxID=1871066 RepID=UPI000FE98B4D|nr:hypothetical protein [Mesorhizobium sp.]RWC91667.1 MAG: hypothetical protein EOS72_03155 [Mesorhizobium sp.]
MADPQLKKGDTVRYVGSLVPAMTGKVGTVDAGHTRNSWVSVAFDGVSGRYARSNLELVARSAGPAPADGARLFNCCAYEAAPDWKQFERLELAGCVDDTSEPGHTIGLQPASKAEFFTIYGRFPEPDGTCEAITDIRDAREALVVAAELALLSRLPVIVHPTLGDC